MYVFASVLPMVPRLSWYNAKWVRNFEKFSLWCMKNYEAETYSRRNREVASLSSVPDSEFWFPDVSFSLVWILSS